MNVWSLLHSSPDTFAMEVPGVGCVVAAYGVGMCFVPGARVRALRPPRDGATHAMVRDDRTTPPLTPSGLSAAEIRAKQALVPDVGALSYLVLDDGDSEY